MDSGTRISVHELQDCLSRWQGSVAPEQAQREARKAFNTAFLLNWAEEGSKVMGNILTSFDLAFSLLRLDPTSEITLIDGQIVGCEADIELLSQRVEAALGEIDPSVSIRIEVRLRMSASLRDSAGYREPVTLLWLGGQGSEERIDRSHASPVAYSPIVSCARWPILAGGGGDNPILKLLTAFVEERTSSFGEDNPEAAVVFSDFLVTPELPQKLSEILPRGNKRRLTRKEVLHMREEIAAHETDRLLVGLSCTMELGKITAGNRSGRYLVDFLVVPILRFWSRCGRAFAERSCLTFPRCCYPGVLFGFIDAVLVAWPHERGGGGDIGFYSSIIRGLSGGEVHRRPFDGWSFILREALDLTAPPRRYSLGRVDPEIITGPNMPDGLPATAERIRSFILSSTAITVVAGAGISAESGIATFRGPNCMKADDQELFTDYRFNSNASEWGIRMATLHEEMEDKEPNAFHRFLAKHPAVGRTYTFNVDDREWEAGVADDKLFQLHGSLFHAYCPLCGLLSRSHKLVRSMYSKLSAGEAVACPSCQSAQSISNRPRRRATLHDWLRPSVVLLGDTRFCTKYTAALAARDEYMRDKPNVLLIVGTSMNEKYIGSWELVKKLVAAADVSVYVNPEPPSESKMKKLNVNAALRLTACQFVENFLGLDY